MQDSALATEEETNEESLAFFLCSQAQSCPPPPPAASGRVDTRTMEAANQLPQWASRHARDFRPPPTTRATTSSTSSTSSSTVPQQLGTSEQATKKARVAAEKDKDQDKNKDRAGAPSRWDFPRVPSHGPQRIGRVLPGLREPAVRQQAMADLEKDMWAATTHRAMEAKKGTIALLLGFWGLLPLPLNAEKILALGSALKMGGYKSAAGYLDLYRNLAERNGQEIKASEKRLLGDAKRSCERGMGGSVKALPLPFERLQELPNAAGAWPNKGPWKPRNAIVAGAWFMLREVELSAAKAEAVTFVPGSRPRVHWLLPASKADAKAVGVTRSQGCLCEGQQFRPDCPYHALLDQVLGLEKRFPKRFSSDGTPDGDLPLFPTREGAPPARTR